MQNWKTTVSTIAMAAILIAWTIYLGLPGDTRVWVPFLVLWWVTLTGFNYTFGYLTILLELLACAIVYIVLFLLESSFAGFVFLALMIIFLAPAWTASMTGLTLRKALDF